MKTFRPFIFATIVLVFLNTSCQRDALEGTTVIKENKSAVITEQASVSAKPSTPGVCNPNAYVITLESRILVNGNWEWVWSIRNPNPGNGNNGTAQDLSNWGMQLGSCVNWSSVISAGYSSNGTSWTNFTPSYAVNPSQGCLTTPVLKFDFGTTGSAKTYYRLVVNQDYPEGPVLGYYKSGSNTNCCTFSFTGIGCSGPVEGPIEIVE